MSTDFWVKLSGKLERFVLRISLLLAWVIVLSLVTISAIDVIGRQVFFASGETINTVMAILFLNMALLFIGAAYLQDAHVRIDILQERFPERLRIWIELIGNLAIILPVCILIIYYGSIQALSNLRQGELLGDFGILGLKGLYEASVPAGFFLFLLASISVTIRNALFLFGKTPLSTTREEIS